jgi:hypothetical protein
MPNVVKILKSTTAGNVPSLVSGQIAINEADGKLFYRNGSGTVTTYTNVIEYATTASFPATGVSGNIYLATDTGRTYRWTSSVYQEVGPIAAPISSAADISSGTLSDARLSANIVTTATLTASSNQSTSVVDVIDRATVTTTRVPNTGTIFFSFFSPVSNVTISSISMATGASVASSVTLARMGLYTWDGTTLTLVARTASDTTLFTSAATVFTRSFDTSGSYPATYTLAAGTRYAVAVIVVASSVGLLLAGNAPNTLAGLTPRVQAARNGASDLQTSVSQFQSTVDTIIWARLS